LQEESYFTLEKRQYRGLLYGLTTVPQKVCKKASCEKSSQIPNSGKNFSQVFLNCHKIEEKLPCKCKSIWICPSANLGWFILFTPDLWKSDRGLKRNLLCVRH